MSKARSWRRWTVWVPWLAALTRGCRWTSSRPSPVATIFLRSSDLGFPVPYHEVDILDPPKRGEAQAGFSAFLARNAGKDPFELAADLMSAEAQEGSGFVPPNPTTRRPSSATCAFVVTTVPRPPGCDGRGSTLKPLALSMPKGRQRCGSGFRRAAHRPRSCRRREPESCRRRPWPSFKPFFGASRLAQLCSGRTGPLGACGRSPCSPPSPAVAAGADGHAGSYQ